MNVGEPQQIVQQVPLWKILWTYVWTWGILGTIVFGASETIGRMIRAATETKAPIKLYIAIIAGPILGVAAYGAGFVRTPAPGFWAWIFALMMGVLCTFGSKTLADLLSWGKDIIAGVRKP